MFEPIVINREEWLAQLITRLVPMIDSVGGTVPGSIRPSVSFPSKGGIGKRQVVGQCWYPIQCEDQTSTNILVSPVISDPLEVAETVLHELVHAAVGPGHGHKGPFIDLARKLGFTKPWKSTPASEVLKLDLQGVLSLLPPYPHGALDVKALLSGAPKPQSTRMKKLECVSCGYTVRVAQKWITIGLPTCPCGSAIEETTPDGGE